MAEKVILETQVVEGFAYNNNLEFYAKGASGWFDLEAGKTYRVVWDGETFTLGAYTETFQGYECVFLGNEAYMKGESQDITDPFLMYRVLANGYCCMASLGTETSHEVGIYEVVEDTPSEPETPEEPTEPEQQEGIILKDRNGEDVAYYGIETVTFDTTTEGKQQVFTKGTVVPRLEVPVTFANGDMVITADPDVSLRELVLQKPADLVPENVRKDKNIGAITGTFIGDTEEITVDLNMANGDQVIIPTADGKVISQVTITKPETLIPENIAEGVDIGGLIGAFKGGSSLKIATGTTSATGANVVIEHGLGVLPDFIYFGTSNSTQGTRKFLCAYGFSAAFRELTGNTLWGRYIVAENTNFSQDTNPVIESTASSKGIFKATEMTFTVAGNSNYPVSTLLGNNHWVAIAGLT